MAPSFDCVVSSLLCEEDDYSIFCDEVDCDDSEADLADDRDCRNRNSYFDESLTGLPEQSDEFLASMVKRECEHLPRTDYLQRLRNGELDLGARMEAVQWIQKALAHFNFGPLCAYLSMNYFDRFLSACELPKDKAWKMQLLAVACLSLAAKVEETNVPLCIDLQVGVAKYVFEAKTIERMELLVLSTLKWRMQAITPFSYIDYFLRKINGDEVPQMSLISHATQLILSLIQGIDFLGFKPSEVAAAVAISVAGETKTVGDIDKTISLLSDHVQKERLVNCIAMIHESSSMTSVSMKVSSASTLTVPRSPIGVLDASCLSFKTDEATVGSCANSSYKSPHSSNKRRKLNRPYEVEI